MKRILLVCDASSIESLLTCVPHSRIIGVIGAVNRPEGHATLQKKTAEIEVPLLIQPHFTSPSFSAFLGSLSNLVPDGLICRSYSMLIRENMRNLVGGHAFNMHASLLPRHRGPNPVQWTLIRGDEQAGVTLHLMDERFDGGDIIAQDCLKVYSEDTWVTLGARLSELADALFVRELPAILAGNWSAVPQDENWVTVNSRIPSESLPIHFDRMSDQEIYNLIRAQSRPLAGAYIDTAAGRQHFPHPLTIDEIRVLRKTIDTPPLPRSKE